jgi:replicative superfamily II helicase
LETSNKIKSKIRENIEKVQVSIPLPKHFLATKVLPSNLINLPNFLKFLIAYFCRHPRRILEEVKKLEEEGINIVISSLLKETGLTEDLARSINSIKVWKGTIGEAMATAYVMGFTDYAMPIFKLRFAPNRRLAMHGDDLLGFKFTERGEPAFLLIGEAKNWKNSKEALKAANATLLKVKNSSPTLLNFVIEELDAQNRHQEAIMVQRFLDEYNYLYKTEYLAFVVADNDEWSDEFFLEVSSNPAIPLEVAVSLIPNKIQESLALPEEKKNTYLTLPIIDIDEVKDSTRLLDNPDFKSQYNRLASAVLASELQVEDRETIQYKLSPEKLEKAARLLTYTGIRPSKDKQEEKENLLYEAARIFERLSIWDLERGDKSKAISSIINSAITYSIAGYSANAKVLVEKVINKIQDIEIPFSLSVLNIANLFLSSKLSELEDELANILFDCPKCNLEKSRTEEDWFKTLGGALAYIGDRLVALAFANFLHYMRTGKDELVKDTLNFLTRAMKAYSSIGEHQSYHLAIILRKYFEKIADDSPQNILPTFLKERLDETWKHYIRNLRLGKFPMITLWKSQKKALEGGLLGSNSLILSMPTSSGKTRTVEFAIYKAFRDNPNGLCVYVVPTRALAAEVEESLSSRLGRMGIGVSALYGGYDFSPFEEEILAENQVIVLTPEKLDLISRQNEEFKTKISLIIIDEAQEIASPSTRGLRAEFILSRIIYLVEKNNARTLCLSAVIQNSEDFAKWISGSAENKIEIDWRPTKHRYGFFQWFRETGQVVYPPLRNEFPTKNFFVPRLFKKDELQNEDRRKTEVAARLALYYSKVGTTLVFTTTKLLVEEIVDILIKLLEINPPEISIDKERIVKECGAILGENHRLIKAIKLGFCYHHSDLPRSVRRIVEKGIRNGVLSLIVSTTTLTQGVNLPIRNIIVHSLYYGREVPLTQFWNAVGRAGRAGYETEGHIIFCFFQDLKRVVDSDLEKSESFISSGIRLLIGSRLPSAKTVEEYIERWALVSTPQFRREGADYKSWGNIKKNNAQVVEKEILSILDSQLLAWALEESIEEIDDEIIEKWLGKMLFSAQTLDIPEKIKLFKSGLKNRFLAVRRSVPNESERKLFNRTGLSISDNRIVNGLAKEVKTELDSLASVDQLPKEFWINIHKKMKEAREFSDIRKIKVNVLVEWVAGKTYKAIADNFYNGKIEKTVKDVEKITFLLPWGLNALIQHLKTLVDENNIPNIINNLSSIVYHGVPSIGSVYAINLGVHDRETAIKMAEIYSISHESVSYKEFKQWLQELDYSFWEANFQDIDKDIIDDCYQRAIAKTYAEGKSKLTLEFYLKQLEPKEGIKKDNLIVVKHNNEFWVCTFDYKKVGKLAGANVERLQEIDRQKKDLVIKELNMESKTLTVDII